MSELRYPASIRQDAEGGDWVVTFRDLDGAITGGNTREAALAEAEDSVGSWLAFALSDRADIPEPSHAQPGEEMIAVPLWIAPKVALYKAMRDQGISNSELARRLHAHENTVRRMLDPKRRTDTKTIEAALRTAGRHLYMVSAAEAGQGATSRRERLKRWQLAARNRSHAGRKG
jgi:antitoxin HicB